MTPLWRLRVRSMGTSQSRRDYETLATERGPPNRPSPEWCSSATCRLLAIAGDAIALAAGGDSLERLLEIVPSEYFCLLRFELLVRGEECLDFAQPVVPNIRERPHMCITRIPDRHGENFKV